MPAISSLRYGFPIFIALFLAAPSASAQQPLAVSLPTANVKLGIVDLRVTEDGFLTLRADLQNDSGRNTTLYDLSRVHPDGVSLVDAANRRRYLVIKDSSGRCLCSNPSVPHGEKLRLWMKFGAPPADVARMDVYIGNLEPVSAVPIGR